MPRFRYYLDPLCLTGCAAYALNRWVIKHYVHRGFFHDHFNDCWLIPCALPLVLWLHRRLGLRAHDDPPRLSEIVPHLIFWSWLFEGIGPRFMPHSTADPWDVVSYWAGGALAWLWWHRDQLFEPLNRIQGRKFWPLTVIPPPHEPWSIRPLKPSYSCESANNSPSPGGEGRGEGGR